MDLKQDLHLAIENGHDYWPTGPMNIDEHDVNYIHQWITRYKILYFPQQSNYPSQNVSGLLH